MRGLRIASVAVRSGVDDPGPQLPIDPAQRPEISIGQAWHVGC
jgi:hypothetical protein